MAPSTKMIGQVFRDALASKIETLPIFLRPQLAAILELLKDWEESVEARLAVLENRQKPETYNAPVVETVPEATARIQAQITRACGNCDG